MKNSPVSSLTPRSGPASSRSTTSVGSLACSNGPLGGALGLLRVGAKATSTGTARSLQLLHGLPFPSWPYQFSPQHLTPRSSIKAQECPAPTATAATPPARFLSSVATSGPPQHLT